MMFEMTQLDRDELLLSPAEVGALVGLSPATIRRWLRTGEVAGVKCGTAKSAPVRVPLSSLLGRLEATGTTTKRGTDE